MRLFLTHCEAALIHCDAALTHCEADLTHLRSAHTSDYPGPANTQLSYTLIHSYKKILYGGHIVSGMEGSGAIHVHHDPSIPELRTKLLCGLIV